MQIILQKPVLTEKSLLAASRGVYTFAVNRLALKSQVKALVEQLYHVQVTKVTSARVHVPAARTGTKRLRVPQSDTKYMRLTLKAGQTIPLFDVKETA